MLNHRAVSTFGRRIALFAAGVAGATLLLAASQTPPAAPSAPKAPAATAPAAAKPRLLLFSKTGGFRHASIPDSIKAVQKLLSDRYDIDATEDSAAFTEANLKRYAAVVFLSTTGDILNTDQKAAFQAYIHGGGGFAGVHAAADTEHKWPWYSQLVGAWFKTHPAPQEALVRVEDRTHRSTRMLPAEWKRFDEWYVYDENPRSRVKVLANLDDSTIKGANMGGDHPIAWYHDFEGGRAWYTGGGHTSESYSEELFLKHLEGGILWAAGAKDDAAPEKTPEAKQR
jgi:type 1 glutamine amidotransferase